MFWRKFFRIFIFNISYEEKLWNVQFADVKTKDGNLNRSFDDLSNSDDFSAFNSKKLIIICYIIAILFGWGSFLLSFLFGSYGFIGFIGLFFPGFMLNSKDPSIRRHAYIQLAIMVIGIIATLLILFR